MGEIVYTYTLRVNCMLWNMYLNKGVKETPPDRSCHPHFLASQGTHAALYLQAYMSGSH